jgi:hypothetical protein
MTQDIRKLAGEVYDRMVEVYGPNPNGPSARDEWLDWAEAKLTYAELLEKQTDLLG